MATEESTQLEQPEQSAADPRITERGVGIVVYTLDSRDQLGLVFPQGCQLSTPDAEAAWRLAEALADLGRDILQGGEPTAQPDSQEALA